MLIKVLGASMIALLVMFLLTCLHYDKQLKRLEEEHEVLLVSMVNLVSHQDQIDNEIKALQREREQ